VFPGDVYAAMLDALPPPGNYRPDNMRKYGRPDGQCSRALFALPAAAGSLPGAADAVWSEVHAALAAPAFAETIASRFGLRDAGSARTTLVRDLPGYWIEPHPDSPAKRITMQFYLARDASAPEAGTMLYRLRPLRPSVWLGRAPAMERAGQFPFHPNTGYAFARRWNSFHGVEPLAERVGERHTLMHVYYRDAARARDED
jgi:hypothetical protein